MATGSHQAIYRAACAGACATALAIAAPARAQTLVAASGAAALSAAALAVAGPPASPRPSPRDQTKSLTVTLPACSMPAEFARFIYPLRHIAQRLARRQPLTIVAIGSSSTAGAGASSPAASYPSRLAAELKQRFPTYEITVLNRGISGEEMEQMMARFASDVVTAHPDLVLWQVGTNSVLRDHPLKSHSVLLREGIAELEQAGADVVLIDLQFAPRVLAKTETDSMEKEIARAAKEANVDLFRRFAVMRGWHDDQHIPFDAFLSPDQLHMNDWSYACVAKLLAAAIGEAATRPIAAAAAHSGR